MSFHVRSIVTFHNTMLLNVDLSLLISKGRNGEEPGPLLKVLQAKTQRQALVYLKLQVMAQ